MRNLAAKKMMTAAATVPSAGLTRFLRCRFTSGSFGDMAWVIQ